MQQGAAVHGPVIRVQHVHRRFAIDGQAAVTALKDISLELAPRSFVSVIGPSGCGKSTLLQIVAGLLPPTSGSVTYLGQRVLEPPFDMIYVFQQYSKSLYPWKTVKQNVAFGLENRVKLDRREIDRRCAHYLGLVGLEGREHSYPWQLSGGMQQRLAIARALICEPRVLLMDEPFSSVDALTRSELQDLLLDLWDEFAFTVLFVTHDIEEAVYLSQRVVVLSQAPAVVADDVAIELPYPRDQISTREDPTYLRYRRKLLEEVFSRERAGGARERRGSAGGDLVRSSQAGG
jgi:NitT/TauT family transport system ATP-binding protein